MTLGRGLLPLVTMAALAVAGCADPCVEVCEAEVGCSPTQQVVDCDAVCEQALEVAVERGCTAQYEDLVECTQGLEDLCVDRSDCDDELVDHAECVAHYCEDNPGGTGCAAE